jgi:hypothetical protein
MPPPVLRIRHNFLGIFLARSDDSISQAHADFFHAIHYRFRFSWTLFRHSCPENQSEVKSVKNFQYEARPRARRHPRPTTP